jgi:hypothetical protein
LREEIEQGQARRHDYCLKKLAFSTGLLGIGALSVPFKGSELDLTPLLWLVPVVVLGFDLYIVSEDFGVKRAGAFLGLPESSASKAEQLWESSFLRTYSSPFASVAFFLVTLVVIAGALGMLLQVGANRGLVTLWITVMVVAELALLLYSLRMRRKFEDAAVEARTEALRQRGWIEDLVAPQVRLPKLDVEPGLAQRYLREDRDARLGE